MSYGTLRLPTCDSDEVDISSIFVWSMSQCDNTTNFSLSRRWSGPSLSIVVLPESLIYASCLPSRQ
jgi:hypothetical protein